MSFEIPYKFARILKTVYGLPASITIITGLWKEGKTDFALFLSECLRKLRLIDVVASNIKTFDNPPRVKFIDSLFYLTSWFFAERTKKVFLYDEVLESTPKRRAMSRLNTEWVKTIPQLSKARGHVIAITQETSLTESVFFNPTFNRGIWRKENLTTASFSSKHLRVEKFIIGNLPKCITKFDPYLQSTFRLGERSLDFERYPMPFQVLRLYAKKRSFVEIKEELDLDHLTQVRRHLQKACEVILTYLQEPSVVDKIGELCK